MRSAGTFLAFFFFLPSVIAVSISPAIIEMDFKPSHEETFRFQTQPAENLDIFIDGELKDLITIEQNDIAKDGTFLIRLKLPEMIETPGENRIFVGLIEKGKGGGMITGIAAIRAPIIIRVPYSGVYVEWSLHVSDLNSNESRIFNIVAKNLGSKAVQKAHASIDIVAQNGSLVEQLQTEERGIDAQDQATFSALLSASKHTAGDYRAQANFWYDQNEEHGQASFRIGTLHVNILNYSDSFIQDKINEFKILVRSGWNEPIKDAFAEITIANKTGTVAAFRTPSLTIEPWREATLASYLDAKGLAPGSYDASITINYQGVSTKDSGLVYIYPAGSQIKLNYTVILVTIILVLLIVNVFLFLRKRKK